jgi:hypothetical protein
MIFYNAEGVMSVERDDYIRVRMSTGEKNLLQRMSEPGGFSMSSWVRFKVYRSSVDRARSFLVHHVAEQEGAGEEAFVNLAEPVFAHAFEEVYGGLLGDLDMDVLFDVLQREGAIAAAIGEEFRFMFLERLADWFIEQGMDDVRVAGMRRFAEKHLMEVRGGEE